MCLCLCACVHKWISTFMWAFGCFCLHVWGLRRGGLGFRGCVAASRPTTFTCLYFGLSALKKQWNRKCIHKPILKNDPISEKLRIGLFVVLWILSSLWGHFHRANRETHYQPAPERSEPELSPSLSPVHPHLPLCGASARCYSWSALGFISAEHLFQWLSLPLLSTAVRVKSRALSLDWNHLSHGPELRLISAEARVRYTAVPTPPLTQGTAESSHRTTQMASTYYTATACQQKSPRLFPFLACKLKRNEMGDWIENIHGTCFLWTYVSKCGAVPWVAVSHCTKLPHEWPK